MFSSDCPVCSSIIEAILIAFPVDGGGELQIHSPHHMRGVGFDLRARAATGPCAWMMNPNLKVFFLPQPVNLLLVHHSALIVPQVRPDATKTMQRTRTG